MVIPFVPADRQNMVAWMAASSDPGQDFGKLTVFRLPEGRNIEGPTQVMSRINQDPTFSAQRPPCSARADRRSSSAISS